MAPKMVAAKKKGVDPPGSSGASRSSVERGGPNTVGGSITRNLRSISRSRTETGPSNKRRDAEEEEPMESGDESLSRRGDHLKAGVSLQCKPLQNMDQFVRTLKNFKYATLEEIFKYSSWKSAVSLTFLNNHKLNNLHQRFYNDITSSILCLYEFCEYQLMINQKSYVQVNSEYAFLLTKFRYNKPRNSQFRSEFEYSINGALNCKNISGLSTSVMDSFISFLKNKPEYLESTIFIASIRCMYVDSAKTGIRYIYPSFSHFQNFPAERNGKKISYYIIPFLTSSYDYTVKSYDNNSAHFLMVIFDIEQSTIYVYDPTGSNRQVSDLECIPHCLNLVNLKPKNGKWDFESHKLMTGVVQIGKNCAMCLGKMLELIVTSQNVFIEPQVLTPTEFNVYKHYIINASMCGFPINNYFV